MASSHRDAVLPPQEGKVATKLEKELLEMVDQSALQIGLRVKPSFRQTEELQHVRVAHICSRCIQQTSLVGEGEHGLPVARQADALEQHRITLAFELTYAPPVGKRLQLIEGPRQRVARARQLQQ